MKPGKKPCIICDKVKCTGSNEHFWIEDAKREVNFLNVYKFNKDVVHTWCIMYKLANDLFAADIMYHKSYMEGYLLVQKKRWGDCQLSSRREKSLDLENM